MAGMNCRIERVAGTRQSDHRAIATLTVLNDMTIDSKVVLDLLPIKRRRELWDRFDYWIDGGYQDKYFHGWPNDPSRKYCFVFKWRDKNQNHRMYGFLQNPTPKSNPRFQVCILVGHAVKTEWETDNAEIDPVNKLRTKPEIMDAVKRCFPEVKERPEKQWVN